MNCTVAGCDGRVYSRNMCCKHYGRWYRYGDSSVVKLTKAPRGEPLRYLNEVILLHKDDNKCLFWPYGRNDGGYGVIAISGVDRYVHVVVCEKVSGPRPSEDYVASHKCGKGHLGCCNPGHLKWQTRIEDRADMVVHGTIKVPRGSQHYRAVLSEDDVLKIHSLKDKYSQAELGEMFGVGRDHISRILSGKRYRLEGIL